MRRGRLGKLGRVNPAYTYARAREGGVALFCGKRKNIELSAISFPTFPSFPDEEKREAKARGYKGGFRSGLLPSEAPLLPQLPHEINI
jgi:hypothetical protein